MNGIPSKIKWKIHICSTLIVFQILKVLPIKTYKILLPVPLFVVVLHQQKSFLQLFRTSFNIAKNIFATNFLSLMDSSVGDPFNGQNPLNTTKAFCWCSLNLKILNILNDLKPYKCFRSLFKLYGDKTNEMQFFKKSENWENNRTKCLLTHFIS